MKKITLTLASVLFSFAAVAQEFTADSNSPINNEINSSKAILWDQPRESTQGIISSANNASGIFSADDFEVNALSTIETITVKGFNNDQSLLTTITGFSLYIYEDLSGVPSSDPSQPGTGVLEIIELDPTDPALTIVQDGGNFTFILDIEGANGVPVVLIPGTYWLVAAPTLNIPDLTEGAERWNWARGNEPADTNIPHIIDVANVFGGGWSSWTPFTAVGITTWRGLAFTIEGEEVLSVGDNILSQVSVYPNPASDVINVRVPANVQINGAALYDVLGKNTGVSISNGQINVAHLSRGVYMLSLETSAGSLVKKIVKQ